MTNVYKYLLMWDRTLIDVHITEKQYFDYSVMNKKKKKF